MDIKSAIHHPCSAPPSEVAVLSTSSSPLGSHVGILYRSDDIGTIRHLHMAWHMCLIDEPRGNHTGWITPSLDGDQLADLRMAAKLIADRISNKTTPDSFNRFLARVPYAIDRADAKIDDGFIRLNGSLGLTCSTFVLIALEFAGIELIDMPSWDSCRSVERIAEDKGAQDWIVKQLRENHKHETHAAMVETTVGCTRVRAEEVAVASALRPHPVTFDLADSHGRILVSEVKSWAT